MATDISGIIAGAENRARDMAGSAKAVLSTVANSLISVSLPAAPTLALPTALALPPMPAVPTLPMVAMPAMPTAPTAPTLATLPDNIGGLTAPSFSGSAPTVNAPSRPAAGRSFTKGAPSINAIAMLPTPPASFVGTAPTMTPITLPAMPTVTRPSFSGAAPAFAAVGPDAATQLEGTYRTASPLMMRALGSEMNLYLTEMNPQYASQMAAIEAKLTKYLEGGTALPPAVENAIYERSRSKTSAEATRLQAEAMTAAARKGFTLPDGVLTSALQRARQVGADLNARAAVEIAVAQAEMEQKNLQFAVSTSADLRKTALNASVSYHQNLISINGQAVQYAQALVDALVKTFDAEVRVFTAKLEGYRADVTVFEALMRASTLDVELYKAQVEAELSKVQVDKGRVDVFRAQIDAHGAAVAAYGKNVEAIVQVAGLERMKLDVFRAEVEAYSAETQGKTAEWQAYSAAWSGEEAKLKGFLAQTQVYSSQVEGYRARVQAESERIKAVATTNQASLEGYTAQVQAFGAQAQANATVVSAQIKSQESLVNMFQAQSQSIVSAASVAAEQYRTVGQIELGKAQLASTVAIEQGKMFTALSQGNAQVAVSAGQVYAGMASAALAGVNALGAAVITS